ncbi:beta-ketoacyl synthase [Streptomyces sp. NPDC088354]|uniref:beta-ketoacyl synthase n=1 Tax=unclassified Streptomyces TaxID=2593676 RepID=UPI0029AF81C6|nr:beta-ketoacyl synthase [Streptomyces sp. MI02-7b]MDX3072648.1 beta-ketoacyl synthase [Streptomyces sp. MI02-7b]
MSAEPSPPPLLRLAGAGMVLPGPHGTACTGIGTFWDLIRDGVSCLSPYAHPELPLRLAGTVNGWNPLTELPLPERTLRRSSRAGLLATAAVRQALAHAGLTASDLDPDRTALVAASLQFAFPESERYYATAQAKGMTAIGMDYWLTGTPPSVVGTVASALQLPCQTLSVAGSCNVALRALQVTQQMFRCGDIDRAVVVGVDQTVDPVFVAGTAHTGRSGYRASSLSGDPADVRPHDETQTGNATGEGAVALVLENPAATGARPGLLHRAHLRSSRSNGPSTVATGPPDNVVRDIRAVLASAGRTPGDVAFVNDYADGNRFVEDHLCQALTWAREATGYRGELVLTNQEAVFGHVAGTGGLVKLLGSLLMLHHGRIAPSANTVVPYRHLPGTPVLAGGRPTTGDSALVLSSGAGGDATSMLLEHEGGDLP